MWKDTQLCIFSRRKGAKNIKEKRKETRKAKKGLLFARSGVSFVVRAWNRVSKIHLATHDWLRILFFAILPSFLHKTPEKKGIIVSKVRVNYYSGIGIQRIIVPPLYTQQKQKFQFSKAQNWCGIIYHHAYTKQCTSTACANQSQSHLLKNCKTNTAIIITCFDSLFFVCLPIDFFLTQSVKALLVWALFTFIIEFNIMPYFSLLRRIMVLNSC